MKNHKPDNYTLNQGDHLHWYVRNNGELVAGFIEQGHAEMFFNLLMKPVEEPATQPNRVESKKEFANVKMFIYKDGVICKYHNRKVVVRKNPDRDGVVIELYVFDLEPENPVKSEHIRGKVHFTGFALSNEAMFSLVKGYQELLLQLNKDNP
jgi:hypothetical protein